MGVEYVTSLSEFNSITRNSGNKLIVVDFYADWCGPCRAIAPLFERLSGQYTGRARFIKVDVDGAPDISQQCGISAMPTFQFFKRGSKVAELQGADPGGLQSTIQQHAPSSSEIAFAGAGQTLGGGTVAEAGPPKVNWDSPAAKEEVQKRREAMAAAAAQRYTAPPPKKEPEPEPEKSTADTPTPAPAAAASSSSGAAASSSAPSASEPKSNDARLKVDQNLLQKMLEMGFPQVRAEKALILTGNKSLEPAMEWCFEHMDDADIDEPLQLVQEDGTEKEVLTPEERKKRANDALLKARKRRQEMDKQAELERERDRIRSGKEVLEAKRKHEENERKIAVEKKRKEKREAALQKKRVQELVAADRAARREKYGGAPVAKKVEEKPKEAPKPAPPPTGGKLQLRFSDGTRMEQHFEPEHTLKDVVDAIVSEKGVTEDRVKLTTMYPKRTFGEEEYGGNLVELKLLPRGVLNVNI